MSPDERLCGRLRQRDAAGGKQLLPGPRQSLPRRQLRTSTERPEALDAGCFVLAGIDADSLLRAVDMAVSMQADGRFGTPVTDYTGENVSTKVARIIQSYTGIVNRLVWRKDG